MRVGPVTSPQPQLRGMAVDAQARLGSASSLAATAEAGAPGAVHEGVEQALRDGVSACWTLGQVLARPRLATVPPPSSAVPAPPYGAPPSPPYGHGTSRPRVPPPWPQGIHSRPGYRQHGSGHHDQH